MAMRWENGSPERKIEAFIGAWGVKTGDILDTDHLLELASRLFEVENSGLADRMEQMISALGPKGRKAMAQKNLAAVMGSAGRFDPSWNGSASPSVSEDGPVTAAALQRMMDASTPHMIDGEPFGISEQLDIDPAKLLRRVVSAVISAGHASDLYEFPEVLAFFGARLPDGNAD